MWRTSNEKPCNLVTNKTTERYLTNQQKTDSVTDITEDIVAINKYYGSYHDCVVVIVDRKDANYIDIEAPYTVGIGNITFSYNYPRPQIVVWKVLKNVKEKMI